jgi:prolyl-tRNA editing enzyme YbaK/EbsC (Cys-tRNA(Pro) deacylase)
MTEDAENQTGPTIEQRVRDTLEQSGFEYDLIDCDPDLADTAAFCAHYGYPPEQSANTIVVASRRPPGEFSAAVVLSHTRLDVNSRVRRLMGVRKASFAPADATAEITGMLMGGVTPFALPATLPLYIDSRVMACPWVIVGGGSRSLKVKLEPRALALLPGAQVIDDLARDVPPA